MQDQATNFIQNYRGVFPLDPKHQKALQVHLDNNKLSGLKRKIIVGRNAGQVYRLVPQPCQGDSGKQIVSMHAVVPLHMMPSDMRTASMTIRNAQLTGSSTASASQCINSLVKSPRLIRELNDM